MKRIFIILIGFALAWPVWGHSVYISYARSESMGFSPGPGMGVLHLGWIYYQGNFSLEKKTGAHSGHCWDAAIGIKLWLLTVGYSGRGYLSRFDDGRVWNKHSYSPEIGIGLFGEDTRLHLKYTLPEKETINKVRGLSLTIQAIINGWSLIANIRLTRYLQDNEMRSGYSMRLGVGIKIM